MAQNIPQPVNIPYVDANGYITTPWMNYNLAVSDQSLSILASQVVKAWGIVSFTGAVGTLETSYNVSGFQTLSSGTHEITIAQDLFDDGGQSFRPVIVTGGSTPAAGQSLIYNCPFLDRYNNPGLLKFTIESRISTTGTRTTQINGGFSFIVL